MAYVLPLLLGLWVPERGYVLGMAAFATVASIVARTAVHMPPARTLEWLVWMNRGTSWIAIWSTAALLLLNKRAQRNARAQEQAREQLLDNLESKNVELERFAYTVSHDLKSPLVTIKGFLGTLERSAMAGDFMTLRTDIGRIAGAADRMRQLLDALLELSRIGRAAGVAAEVSLDEVLAEALEALRGPITAAGASVQVSSPLPRVRGDRVQIRQVFQNLIENAVKFSTQSREPSVEVAARRDGGHVVVSVKDNGIGIEPGDAQRVFGLFEQVDPRTPGTGVGLALVRRVVEVHGGQVWVESAGAGLGSTFWFSLPPGSTSGDQDVTKIMRGSPSDGLVHTL